MTDHQRTNKELSEIKNVLKDIACSLQIVSGRKENAKDEENQEKTTQFNS